MKAYSSAKEWSEAGLLRNDFDECLLRLLIDNRIKITQLAESIGCKEYQVRKILNRERSPSLGFIIRVARHFDITVDSILELDK